MPVICLILLHLSNQILFPPGASADKRPFTSLIESLQVYSSLGVATCIELLIFKYRDFSQVTASSNKYPIPGNLSKSHVQRIFYGFICHLSIDHSTFSTQGTFRVVIIRFIWIRIKESSTRQPNTIHSQSISHSSPALRIWRTTSTVRTTAAVAQSPCGRRGVWESLYLWIDSLINSKASAE